MEKKDGKKRTTKKSKGDGKKRGWNFRDSASLRKKEEENKQRQPEIIETYLRVGTYYQAAKDLDIPRSTLRQLIIKWEKSGDVDLIRQKLKIIEGPCNILNISGEIISLDRSDEGIKATVTFKEEILKDLHLGKIEMRFISQEISEGGEQGPGPV